jgi:hypothetical protein
MNRWRPVFLAVCVLALMLTLTLVFREAVRNVILVPILHLAWLLWNFLASFSQGTLWIFFICVFLLILIGGLRQPRQPDFLPQTPQKTKPAEHGRVYYWARQVNMMAVEGYSRIYSLLELRKLVLAQLAFHERLTRKQVEQRIDAQALDLPPEILTLINLDEKAQKARPPTLAERIKQLYQWIFRRDRNTLPPELRRELTSVIDYLEEHQP